MADYLSPMLPRALWTAVLALLAWLPVGRGQSRAVHVDLQERALFAVSALDVATDPPSRFGELRVVATQAARPGNARRLSEPGKDGPHSLAHVGSTRAPTWRPSPSPRPTGWRGYRDERLIQPHDATAPPPRQS
jgi:hypothetical protein